ncbi:MAG: TonB-dependent receptor [Spirochaetota bacterium]
MFSEGRLQKSSKTVGLSRFSPYKTSKSTKHEENIYNNLRKYLQAQGYTVAEIKGATDGKKQQDAKSRGSHIYIDGYYEISSNENLNLYIQIYDPDTGYVIDASNITDELEGLEGLRLDKEEMFQPHTKTLQDAGEKIVLRLKINEKKRVRRENIDKNISYSKIGKDIEFRVPPEDIKAKSKEVFELLAQKDKITVASNLVTDKEKQPASVYVIQSEQIQMSGARTINELLTIYVPGFFLVEDQDDTIAGFRGFAPDNNAKVLLLLNGYNINTEWFWGPPDSIINGLHMDYIERIEVIRGPGSVTLGQGALLGVINIVTKRGSAEPKGHIGLKYGANDYESKLIDYGTTSKYIPGMKAYFHVNSSSYKGQKIRPEGWAKAQPYESTEGYYDFRDGLTEVVDTADVNATDLQIWPVPGDKTLVTRRNVVTGGSRLKRAKQNTLLAQLDYQNFHFTGFHNDQSRNLYNFYRDRNIVRNIVDTANLSYNHEFSTKLSMLGKVQYTRDDVVLLSNGGVTMGGTRENRYGGTFLLYLKEVIPKNNLAIGLEHKKYDMGQRDLNGNNYIVNSIGTNLFDDPNTKRRYVYPDTIAVSSIMLEDFYRLTQKMDLFAAVRYDKHPFWGANLSPRLGALYEWNPNLRFRLSYQQGFRGVVGVSYSGGFQGDGHLRIENFQNIEVARIPTEDVNGNATFYRNVPETKPEKMDSYEFATKWKPSKAWVLETIFFYNKVKNIIDVGVLFADSAIFTMPRLGSDEPGDWNGYWFYKNAAGEIRQGGIEFSLDYRNRYLRSSLSHSIVKLITASNSQLDSVYLTSDSNNRHFKGYPENITRWNNLLFITKSWSASLNYLFYPNWYSPRGNRIEGNHIVNTGLSYRPVPPAKLYIVVKNLLNQSNLYPMISNSGGETLSDGTPALEKRTFWLGFEMSF